MQSKELLATLTAAVENKCLQPDTWVRHEEELGRFLLDTVAENATGIVELLTSAMIAFKSWVCAQSAVLRLVVSVNEQLGEAQASELALAFVAHCQGSPPLSRSGKRQCGQCLGSASRWTPPGLHRALRGQGSPAQVLA